MSNQEHNVKHFDNDVLYDVQEEFDKLDNTLKSTTNAIKELTKEVEDTVVPAEPDVFILKKKHRITIARTNNNQHITNIKYVSSDTKIATVSSDGVVTRVPGNNGETVTITITADISEPDYGIIKSINTITYKIHPEETIKLVITSNEFDNIATPR